MLAIQKIEMYWLKENRTPEGSVMRREFYKPARLKETVDLNGNGIFVNERNYIQMDKVYLATDYRIQHGNPYANSCGLTKKQEEERRHQHLLEVQNRARKNEGIFYETPDHVELPGILIVEEEDGYRVKWYSFENGFQPVRTGHNEDYCVKGSKCKGKRLLCETAFCLKKGESGKIQFNYRYTSFMGQHYEQYCIYFLNAEKLEQNSFVQAQYEKEYNQLVNLF